MREKRVFSFAFHSKTTTKKANENSQQPSVPNVLRFDFTAEKKVKHNKHYVLITFINMRNTMFFGRGRRRNTVRDRARASQMRDATLSLNEILPFSCGVALPFFLRFVFLLTSSNANNAKLCVIFFRCRFSLLFV